MRRIQLLKGVLWGLTLWCMTGCINSRFDPARLSPEALASVPVHRLCEAYTWNRSPELRAELKRRGTFTELEWQAIDGRKVVLGMGEMALMTALPGIVRTRTYRSNGVLTKEWQYSRVTTTRVRTENGKVVWFR